MHKSEDEQDRTLLKLSELNFSDGAPDSLSSPYATINELRRELVDLNTSKAQDSFLSQVNRTWKQYHDWENYVDKTRDEQFGNVFRLSFISNLQKLLYHFFSVNVVRKSQLQSIEEEIDDIRDAGDSGRSNTWMRLNRIREHLNYSRVMPLVKRIAELNDKNDLAVRSLLRTILDRSQNGSRADVTS